MGGKVGFGWSFGIFGTDFVGVRKKGVFRQELGRRKGGGVSFAIALPVGFCSLLLYKKVSKRIAELPFDLNGRMSQK